VEDVEMITGFKDKHEYVNHNGTKSVLYLMDCMEGMSQIPDKHFDLAIVDPPYGINYDIMQNEQADNERISNGGKWLKYHKTKWDSETPTDEYWQELFRVSKNQIIWGGNYFYKVDLTGIIIWNKGKNGTMKEGELAKTSFNTFKIFDYSRIDAYVNSGSQKIHPTQKPIKLYDWLLHNYAKQGDKILDTHVGSGSSRIACDKLDFDFTGFEIDEDYFHASVKRFENFVSQLRICFK
jgi:site-specific DNA-methyltransferase (adenine-specific)